MKEKAQLPQHERGFEFCECPPEDWEKAKAMAAERHAAWASFEAEFFPKKG